MYQACEVASNAVSPLFCPSILYSQLQEHRCHHIVCRNVYILRCVVVHNRILLPVGGCCSIPPIQNLSFADIKVLMGKLTEECVWFNGV